MACVNSPHVEIARLGIDRALDSMARTVYWDATAQIDEFGLIVTLRHKPMLFGMVETPLPIYGAAMFVKWLPKRWQMRRVLREALSTIPPYLRFKAEEAVRRAQENSSV